MEKRVPDLKTIDVSSRFCDETQCYYAVGGVSVYFDGLHLSGAPTRAPSARGCRARSRTASRTAPPASPRADQPGAEAPDLFRP